MSNQRTVLVTGGAGGIGHAIAETFLAAGDRVVLADINADAVAKVAAELGCEGRALDIADPKQAAEVLAGLKEEFGGVDVLVNNAGILNIHAPVLELDPDDLDKITHVNIRGTFVMTQAVGRQMIEAGTKGTIVNVSSIGGRQPTPGMGAYEASKAAVDQLTRWAAIEYAEHGIRVNAAAPGPVLTPQMRAGMDESSPFYQAWVARIPLKQMAEPSDVADTVFFLAGEHSRHITGVSLAIDGGQLLA